MDKIYSSVSALSHNFLDVKSLPLYKRHYFLLWVWVNIGVRERTYENGRVSLDTALLLVFSCHFRDTALGAVLQKRQKEAPDSERRLKKDRLWSLS